MLTLEAILKTTRQMTAYGEHGLPSLRDRSRADNGNAERVDVEGSPTRKWDDEKNVYVYV
ncbi:hypothetical protein [Rhizobium sp. BK176]|uniref:hypothetical protein n=1 Tax=Rhizobium sp. BK176 TaxID=2587071 RepID=UPI002168265D|nr:hypothetical protein [Rhizobium sp. BK176]MCS4089639.1 hypothetical protein [Rhizobium sp. BK176]